jgi:hypothetical protein
MPPDELRERLLKLARILQAIEAAGHDPPSQQIARSVIRAELKRLVMESYGLAEPAWEAAANGEP